MSDNFETALPCNDLLIPFFEMFQNVEYPFLQHWIFDIFIILLTLVASFEVCNLMEKSNRKVNKIFTVFYAIFNYVIALLYFDKVNFSMILVIEFIALIL